MILTFPANQMPCKVNKQEKLSKTLQNGYCELLLTKLVLTYLPIYTHVSCNFLKPKLRPFAAGNCRHTSWPRPWPTINTHKFCILSMVQHPNIRLKTRSQKVTGLASIYSIYYENSYYICVYIIQQKMAHYKIFL